MESESVSCSVVSDSLWTPWTATRQVPLHGILQARILEWVAISFSRGSSWPRNRTRVSRIAGRFFNVWTTRGGPGSNGEGDKIERDSVEISPSCPWCGLHKTCIFPSIRPDGAAWRESLAGLSDHGLRKETTSSLESPGGRVNLPVSFQHQHDHLLHAACPGDDATVPVNLHQNVGRLGDDRDSLR